MTTPERKYHYWRGFIVASLLIAIPCLIIIVSVVNKIVDLQTVQVCHALNITDQAFQECLSNE